MSRETLCTLGRFTRQATQQKVTFFTMSRDNPSCPIAVRGRAWPCVAVPSQQKVTFFSYVSRQPFVSHTRLRPAEAAKGQQEVTFFHMSRDNPSCPIAV